MTCDPWSQKLDAYLDGELSGDDAGALDEHLRGCAACAAESLRRVQEKHAIQSAGLKFVPDAAFRSRMEKKIAKRTTVWWKQRWFPVLAAVATVVFATALLLNVDRTRTGEDRVIGELADLHVATLASANPVDVLSTDRHTVKPWFAGRIPFTFNLPDLQSSPFSLIGGRVSYLGQSPGAELIYRIRQHQISVFIFQDRNIAEVRSADRTILSFQVRSWTQNGLRYFVIGDANAQDLDALREMIKAAG